MNESLQVIKESVDRVFGNGSSGKIVAEAVEAERKRWVTLLTKAKDVATKNANYPIADALRDCRDAGACWAPEPEPPPPEPMTIAKVLANIRSSSSLWRHGPDCEKDLILLVKEQARRDAEKCGELWKEYDETDKTAARQWGQIFRIAILVSAGLE